MHLTNMEVVFAATSIVHICLTSYLVWDRKNWNLEKEKMRKALCASNSIVSCAMERDLNNSCPILWWKGRGGRVEGRIKLTSTGCDVSVYYDPGSDYDRPYCVESQFGVKHFDRRDLIYAEIDLVARRLKEADATKATAV